jgi:hypothetical protein
MYRSIFYIWSTVLENGDVAHDATNGALVKWPFHMQLLGPILLHHLIMMDGRVLVRQGFDLGFHNVGI